MLPAIRLVFILDSRGFSGLMMALYLHRKRRLDDTDIKSMYSWRYMKIQSWLLNNLVDHDHDHAHDQWPMTNDKDKKWTCPRRLPQEWERWHWRPISRHSWPVCRESDLEIYTFEPLFFTCCPNIQTHLHCLSLLVF